MTAPDVGKALGLAIAVVFLVNMGMNAVLPLFQTHDTAENFTNIREGTVIQMADYPVLDDSETIEITGGAELTKDTNYTVVDYDTGEFNITDLDGNESATTTANLTVSYTWHDESYLEGSTERAVAMILPIGLILMAVYPLISKVM